MRTRHNCVRSNFEFDKLTPTELVYIALRDVLGYLKKIQNRIISLNRAYINIVVVVVAQRETFVYLAR